MRRALVLFATLSIALFAPGCGDDDDGGSEASGSGSASAPADEPTGAVTTLTAADIAFDPTEITLTAGEAASIELVNEDELRLGALVRRCEGEAPIVECFSREAEAKACRIAPVCRLRGALAEGFEALYQALDRYTLADLAGNERPLRLALLGEQLRPRPARARRSGREVPH